MDVNTCLKLERSCVVMFMYAWYCISGVLHQIEGREIGIVVESME